MLSILILVLATTASSAKDYRLAFEAAYAKFSARDGLLRSEPINFIFYVIYASVSLLKLLMI